MRTLRVLVTGAALLWAWANAHAVVPQTETPDYEIAPPLEATLYLHQVEAIHQDPAAANHLAAIEAELGPGWFITSWNQFAQTPRLVGGPGVLIAPGGLANATAQQVEALGRAFIDQHPALFRTASHNLVTQKVHHGVDKWGLVFAQLHQGVEVIDSHVILAIHDNGRLYAWGANVYHVDIQTLHTIEPVVARSIARSAVPFTPEALVTNIEEQTLILPVHAQPGEVRFHLVHQTDVPTLEPDGMWRTYVDAHSGDIRRRTNLVHNAYEGSTQGDVEILNYCDGDTPDAPQARMNVAISGVGTAVSDDSGNFSIAGNSGPHSYTAEFNGPNFNVNCIGCADAQLTGTINPDTPEVIDFDVAAARPDERDTFYFANLTRMFVESIDPTFNLTKYTIEVNSSGNCNAFHNWPLKRLRFLQEGGGCANTGRLGDVVAHEYGHGIQGLLMGGGSQGQQGLGEGNADIAGNFITENPQVGIGFNNCNGGLTGRNCDNELVYPDDLVGQVHTDGRIICGFNWDVWQNLQATHSPEDAKAHTAHLWHFSRKLFGSSGMIQPEQADAYLVADDDNGDLSDGTPNWDAICESSIKHGYGCAPNPNRILITHTPLVDTDDPSGPYIVDADVVSYVAGVSGTPDQVELNYAVNGGAFQQTAMTLVAGNTYEGAIPTQPAGTAIAYYLRATEAATALEVFDPEDAPASYHLFAVGSYTTVADDAMEVDPGYTIGAPGDDATSGIWVRDDPNGVVLGPTTYVPEDDHTVNPGSHCWITGNPPAGTASPFVDELDGKTTLTTPTYAFGNANLVQGSVWLWSLVAAQTGDFLDFDISTDGGSNWVTLTRLETPTTPDWQEVSFRLSPHDFAFTDQTLFRFVAWDTPPDNIVNFLVDDFFVEGLFGGTTGLAGVNSAPPAATRLGRASPNPFNPSTTIDFEIAHSGPVTLAVYDVAGRLVRRLVDNRLEAGVHAASWDGRDEHQRAMSSGVYYYRLSVGDFDQTRSMVLVR